MAKDNGTFDGAAKVDQVGVVARRHRVLVEDRFPPAPAFGTVLCGDGAEPTDSESVYVGERVRREAVVARAVAGIVLLEFGKVVLVDCGG